MKKKVLVSFILDETGSMESVKSQTISGFNEYIDTLKNDKNSKNMLFTLTQFNSNKVEVVYDAVTLEKVAHRDEKNYRPVELTPLYDAIGATIRSLEDKVSGKKQPALVVIQTDGQENASKEFSRESIFKLIDEKKKLGWTFVFLGADQDAWEASQAIGIFSNTVSYAGSNTKGTISGVASGTSAYVANSGAQTNSFYEDADKIAK